MFEPPHVVVDPDGAAATAEAVRHAGRTAVWVGTAQDPELEEFVAEITARVNG